LMHRRRGDAPRPRSRELDDRDLGDRVLPSIHCLAFATGGFVAFVDRGDFCGGDEPTVSTSLNSSATLVMKRFLQRLFRPNRSMRKTCRRVRGIDDRMGSDGTGDGAGVGSINRRVRWTFFWCCSGVARAAIVGTFCWGSSPVPAIRQIVGRFASLGDRDAGGSGRGWPVFETSMARSRSQISPSPCEPFY